MDAELVDVFDAATSVRRLGAASYRATLSEDYAVLGNPNGGYLLAVVANSALTYLAESDSEHPHCLAASASFVQPARCGDVDIELSVHRRGSRITHLAALVRQGDEVKVDALLTCGRLDADANPRYEVPCDVVLPPVEECERRPAEGLPGVSIAIMDRVELLLDPATAGFAHGRLSEAAEVRGWLRLADGRPMDPLGLLFAADVLPPATFAIGSTGWVPTLQLSAFVRSLPAPGWLVARQRARAVVGGLVDEICEIWDARGRIVAQATQLAMVSFPT